MGDQNHKVPPHLKHERLGGLNGGVVAPPNGELVSTYGEVKRLRDGPKILELAQNGGYCEYSIYTKFTNVVARQI